MVLKVADHGPGESVRREGEFYMKYLVGIPGRPTLYARGTVLGINGKNLEFLLLEDMGTPLAEDLEELDEMSRLVISYLVLTSSSVLNTHEVIYISAQTTIEYNFEEPGR